MKPSSNSPRSSFSSSLANSGIPPLPVDSAPRISFGISSNSARQSVGAQRIQRQRLQAILQEAIDIIDGEDDLFCERETGDSLLLQ